MIYWVSVAIDGRYTAEVEADSFAEAKDIAKEAVCEANFGELKCVDWQVVNAECEDGRFVDY